MFAKFWSGVDLTGNQIFAVATQICGKFWSGVDLTGNQILQIDRWHPNWFWSGVDLTGNQTGMKKPRTGGAEIGLKHFKSLTITTIGVIIM